MLKEHKVEFRVHKGRQELKGQSVHRGLKVPLKELKVRRELKELKELKVLREVFKGLKVQQELKVL